MTCTLEHKRHIHNSNAVTKDLESDLVQSSAGLHPGPWMLARLDHQKVQNRMRTSDATAQSQGPLFHPTQYDNMQYNAMQSKEALSG